MYKKILVSLGLLVLLAGIFGVQTVQAADSLPWYDGLPTDVALPIYSGTVDLTTGNGDMTPDFGGCTLTSFGDYQLHLLDDVAPTAAAGFYRVVVVTDDDMGDNQWAVLVSDAASLDELACMEGEDGVVDMVVPVGVGQDVIITLASVGNYTPTETEFETYVARFVNGGGLIVDMIADDGDVNGRDVQASSETEAVWGVPDTAGNNVFFIDVADGIYNLGIVDTGKPFATYYPEIEAVGFEYLTPGADSTISNTVELDECGPDDPALVALNVNAQDGFLFEDLEVGYVAPAGDFLFWINPGYLWDLAVIDNDGDFNYFLVVNGFADAQGDLQFFLCEDGAQIVELLHDWSWDSAKLTLDPYGNLNERGFWFTEGWKAAEDGYEGETFFLVAKNGCCAEAGPFEPVVKLDHYEHCCPACPDCVNVPFDEYGYYDDCMFDCATVSDEERSEILPGQEEIDCDNPPCPAYLPCDKVNEDIKWWYTFTPSESPWLFEHVSVEDYLDYLSGILETAEISYATTFGDGPFWTDAGVSKLEYVAGETAELTYGGDWYDADDNILELVEIWEWDYDVMDWVLDTDVPPTYEVVENVTYALMPDLEAITDIGRYKFSWAQEHGYLGDIFGHESEWEQTCCGCCEDSCMDPCPYLEVPHYADGGEAIFAISPVDVRMNGNWAWSWVMAMYELDLTTGVSPTLYAPNLNITRAEVAAFIARIMEDEGLGALGVATVFPDVVDHWFEDEIMLLADYGIVSGDGGMFYPQRELMRDEMAKMLLEAFQAIKIYAGTDYHWDENMTVQPTGEIFADVPASFWAVAYIEELYADGLTDGCGYDDGNLFYCPNDKVTRAQMAKFVISALLEEVETQGFWPVLAPEK
jgi:hypothetical protein